MTDSEEDGIGAGSVGFRGWNVGSLSSETSEDEDDILDEPPHKKNKIESQPNDLFSEVKNVNYNPVAANMLKKMGWQEGKGVGKNEQGMTGIIEASKQRGRRGLGLEVKGFEQDDSVVWNFEQEAISIDETIEWLPENYSSIPSLEVMESWLKTGPKLKDVPLTSEFCKNETVEKVVECKSVFDNLENEEMRRAKTKSNPFETIRGGIFQNRAAMKMANMDAVSDFMFTNPRDENGEPVLQTDELLYFADICAGPGGFSEYVLWRRKCTARGFGFTLKGANDFKLHEFYTAPSELFEPHYGEDDDGDIYKPKNLISFRQFVIDSTDGKGVHFVMADGGFSVDGQENLQEIKSNRLYLCQFLCALSILQPGGHFVCKLFDIFTNYSTGLIYLMYLAFHQISIFKPVTSRPANSERYIICKSKRPDCMDIHDYMFSINEKFQQISGVLSNEDVSEVVPLDVMKSNEQFMNYIVNSNEKLGEVQCTNLEKIKVFAQNPNLHDYRQAELREICLKRWDVPDQVRAAPNKEEPANHYNRLLNQHQVDLNDIRPLTAESMKAIHSRYDYKFVVVGSAERWLILSSGRSQVHMKNARGNWQKMMFNNCMVNVELPRDTLLEVEFVYEMRGEGKGQRKTVAIHVLDALVIYGENLMSQSYEMRIFRAKLFCKSVNKTTRTDLAPLRVKEQFDLSDLHEYYDRLVDRIIKGQGQVPRQCYRSKGTNQDVYYVPRGLLLVKIVKDPWFIAYSRSSTRFYYYNSLSRQSVFEIPKDAGLSFPEHQRDRMIWYRQNPDNPVSKQCVSEDDLHNYLSKLPP